MDELKSVVLKFMYATEDGDVQEIGGVPLAQARKAAKKLLPEYKNEAPF